MKGKVFIHKTAQVEKDVTIGSGSKIWHFSHIMSGAKLGTRCIVGQNVMIGRKVIVGDGCKIQNNVSLYTGVKLASNVFCGPSVVFTNVLNPRAFIERKDEFLETFIGDCASIGANATILCGITIGSFSLIAAGAVVTKSVPNYGLVLGNPAKLSGWVSKAGEVLKNDLICPRDGSQYTLKKGFLEPL